MSRAHDRTMFGETLRQFALDNKLAYWVGPTPNVAPEHVASVVAGHLGYPTARTDPFSNGGLVRLTRGQAAHVLAVAATTCLAYEEPVPDTAAVNRAIRVLVAMGPGATFLGNGYWDTRGLIEWTPMTDATFDCGVIGHDEHYAFIVWVEAED